MCLSGIAKFLPTYTPRDDFEILALISWQNRPPNPTEAQIAAQIAEEREIVEMEWGDKASEMVHNRLDEMVEPTGVSATFDKVFVASCQHKVKFKPTAETRHVHTRTLPGTKYSIRLFPGQYAMRLWSMDFVLTATGEPVNSPFEFELFSVPNPKTPWLFGLGGWIRSAERSFGIKQDEILPGEEKYLLQDDQTCLLRRPGKRTVRFTVPIRPLPGTEEEPEECDDLDFPEVLSPSDP